MEFRRVLFRSRVIIVVIQFLEQRPTSGLGSYVQLGAGVSRLVEPDVADPVETSAVRFHWLLAVVHHYQFRVVIALLEESTECLLKETHSVPCRQDAGDEFCHAGFTHASSP